MMKTLNKLRIKGVYHYIMGIPLAQLVKNPPAMCKTWVGKIPWRRETEKIPLAWEIPLQYSCLENSIECIVYEVTKTTT